MTADLFRVSLAELSTRLGAGTLTSEEVVASCLARIEALNPSLNAVVALNAKAAEEARASDARRARGVALGPLDGLPIAVKDNILTRDLPTLWGSPAYPDPVAPRPDETPVERLKAAGAVIIAKTNVPEFTLEGFTDNSLFGPTRNPYDLSVTPGGSSGGSVAGVAAGMFPAALGTDGGGSIRRPCAYTGLFGLKPTIGRIARARTLPQILLDMEVVGPITRSVADAALLFDAIEGPAPDDPRSWLPAEPEAGLALDAAPGPLRILYVERFQDAPLDPVIGTSLRQAADRLADLGHRVTAGPLPFDVAALTAAWPRIGQAGLAFLKGQLGPRFERAGAKYRAMAGAGEAMAAGELFTLLDLIARLREQAAAAFQGCDVILTPSCAAMAWPVGQDYPPVIDGRKVGPRGHAVYTGWVNAIGHPAVNLPAPAAPVGMPIGAHLVGAHNRDRLLLRLARHYEAQYPWADLWPAISGT